MILPFAICLRSTIQKFGAVIGLGLFWSVRYRKGRDALADMARRNCPLLPLQVKSSSSFSGCAILLIFAFKIFWFNSYTILKSQIHQEPFCVPLFILNNLDNCNAVDESVYAAIIHKNLPDITGHMVHYNGFYEICIDAIYNFKSRIA